jgi:hypothetical protein
MRSNGAVILSIGAILAAVRLARQTITLSFDADAGGVVGK